MALTPEQVKTLKQQLLDQIKTLPEDQKAQAEKEINDMTPEVLESWLKQQQSQASSGEGGTQQPIFRAIVSGEIPSKTIDQNAQAIAVLSVKAISKGHTIIIPKNPITDAKKLPPQTFTLAKKIAKKIESKLKASSTEIQTESAFGEVIIHIIPIYDKPLDLKSPREDASEEDLSDLYAKLKTPKKLPVIKMDKKKQTKAIKIKRRIP